jgi:hypothetical protein
MSTNNFFQSDIFGIYNIVQASMLVYPKEIIISTLRDIFSKDSYYHYSKDKFGFANTTDHTDLPLGADIPVNSFGSTAENNDNLSTRIFIGENFRKDSVMYPAILVKNGGSKYVPISINREKGSIQYENFIYEDEYGNQVYWNKPTSFITAGAWEGSIIIDIMTRSLRTRDDLVEIVGMIFTEIAVDSIYDIGIIIKPPVIGSPSEIDDRNDKIFRQTITLDIRTEWRRNIPINSLIDAIMFTVNFENLSNTNAPAPQNLTINTEVTLLDMLLNS